MKTELIDRNQAFYEINELLEDYERRIGLMQAAKNFKGAKELELKVGAILQVRSGIIAKLPTVQTVEVMK